jgi:hypothetical protein
MTRAFLTAAMVITMSSIFAQSLSALTIHELKRIKRGNSHQITWVRSSSESEVVIELINDSSISVASFKESNDGDAQIQIPRKTKKGNYRLKLTDLGSNESILSPTFKIVPKIPLWAKIAPVFLVPVIFIIFNKEESKTIPIYPPSPS